MKQPISASEMEGCAVLAMSGDELRKIISEVVRMLNVFTDVMDDKLDLDGDDSHIKRPLADMRHAATDLQLCVNLVLATIEQNSPNINLLKDVRESVSLDAFMDRNAMPLLEISPQAWSM